jgi:ATP-binding cassette subfamily B (MDR/TAP) protein 1
VKKGVIIGILYGLCQFLVFVSFAILFWIGSIILRDHGNVLVEDAFIAIFAIVWAGWTAGNNFFFLPDIGAGKRGAARLFELNDSKD